MKNVAFCGQTKAGVAGWLCKSPQAGQDLEETMIVFLFGSCRGPVLFNFFQRQMQAVLFRFQAVLSIADWLWSNPQAEKLSRRTLKQDIGVGMGTVRVDKKGRILIPVSERRRLGLKVGNEFEITVQDSAIILRPIIPKPIRVNARGRQWGREAFLDAGKATFGC